MCLTIGTESYTQPTPCLLKETEKPEEQEQDKKKGT